MSENSIEMPTIDSYIPSPSKWVADQVEAYERSGGTEANTLRDTGIPIIVLTTTGSVSGATRKFALMRVEHEGEYALVASKGGAEDNPKWYGNILADMDNVWIQDGPEPQRYVVRDVTGEERDLWWGRSVAVFAPYAEYATKTDRVIPVMVATLATTSD
jgi:F420H(2)-dependent quinone reductase